MSYILATYRITQIKLKIWVLSVGIYGKVHKKGIVTFSIDFSLHERVVKIDKFRVIFPALFCTV